MRTDEKEHAFARRRWDSPLRRTASGDDRSRFRRHSKAGRAGAVRHVDGGDLAITLQTHRQFSNHPW